ncbi:3-oxoacyl-[acyl-carrier-protein] reductase [Prauserella shujinwangii]|uniref:3-oxoacyl-[acyl-carrier-protein] reductase n=1 Tax=Prauserella shujinwangii TaxID=1453103 RepID=A0A2T0M0H1_9PSEU|nr:SDR family NAD(P)-dependent oxidoreductase [Prauserella shujinwangii]PRX50103.1 3-oxoacyl-[acyl-carrier-protein] reductase [Prauserella shujinwangii]
MRRYDNHVAMITGAAQGLGRAIAERLSIEGASVSLCDINSVALKEAAAKLDPARTVTCPADVTDDQQVKEWFALTLSRFGKVDILVSNAGVIRDNRLENMGDTDWDVVLDTNLRGMFHCCRAVFPHMKEQNYGRIVGLTSMCWRGNFGQANYSAAKAGVVALARTIALEGAAHGITANAVAPGLIDTPMLASMDARARDKLVSRVPQRRVGRPEEIAETVAFLCSKTAGYITGIVLDVDGGIGIGSSLR